MSNGDYVLGTGDEEVDRLGFQHRVWRDRVLDAWARAGFSAGDHLVDIGCGPGYATLDLAAMTGSAGRVTAIDRSSHFLEVLDDQLSRAQCRHVVTRTLDLDREALPRLDADGAWCRWILAFVADPRQLLTDIHATLKPGARFVIHEYFDYRTWRLMPRRPPFEEFVSEVMRAWRENGGEPDVALDLVSWLADAGFDVLETRPFVDIVSPADDRWQWPAGFVNSGLHRLIELGRVTPQWAQEVRQSLSLGQANPTTRMITPGVLEIIAARR
jgi:SAM-dependent methyltransferase